MGEKDAFSKVTISADPGLQFGFEATEGTTKALLAMIQDLQGQLADSRTQLLTTIEGISRLGGDTLFDAELLVEMVKPIRNNPPWIDHREGEIDPRGETYNWNLYTDLLSNIFLNIVRSIP